MFVAIQFPEISNLRANGSLEILRFRDIVNSVGLCRHRNTNELPRRVVKYVSLWIFFTADFSPFLSIYVKSCQLDGRLGTRHQIRAFCEYT